MSESIKYTVDNGKIEPTVGLFLGSISPGVGVAGQFGGTLARFSRNVFFAGTRVQYR